MKLNIPSLSADNRGVSPVAGVILMVEMTVILAAVIGTFVLGLGDQLGDSVNAGVSVEQGDTNITVTLVNIGNADSVELRQDGSQIGEALSSAGDTTTTVHSDQNVQVVAIKTDGTEALTSSPS